MTWKHVTIKDVHIVKTWQIDIQKNPKENNALRIVPCNLIDVHWLKIHHKIKNGDGVTL